MSKLAKLHRLVKLGDCYGLTKKSEVNTCKNCHENVNCIWQHIFLDCISTEDERKDLNISGNTNRDYEMRRLINDDNNITKIGKMIEKWQSERNKSTEGNQ